MNTVVRFAPSPTGNIHIGNARPALFNWLFALKTGGRFILRFDDTDRARSTEEYAANIVADLSWLGIRPHASFRQSDRLDRYEAAKADLVAKGLLYPCYETAEELEYARKRRLARRLPPVYDRAALRLTDADRARLEAEGRRPHWRFLLPNFDGDPLTPSRHLVHWQDLCRGEETVDLASLSDPVLIRADGTCLYTLTSVVDDIDTAVTHIIRGSDHITNTGVQISLFEALDGAIPIFAHHNLLTDASGEGFSKRTGSLSLRSLRAEGYEPEAVASLAVNVGTSHAVEKVGSLAELAADFDLAAVSRSSAKFDPNELRALNARIVHGFDFSTVQKRLTALGIPAHPAFWQAVKGNCMRLADAADWWKLITGPVTPLVEEADRDFLEAARDALPPEPWTDDSFREWTSALKAKTGRKGRDLFLPLRKALTGLDHGPELAPLLPLIGAEAVRTRLSTAIGH
ncbi:Glutamate--tRNA ligase 1 [uncultured Pleomorphomonas sp.]|uniref:Glutamate--tRNA ligase n=1 Tax=uncultured Pleomorphomonas sp. TaxID=442121 RepID=A0A212KZW6_9HYPH|nr:glutamate--tRNA ligase [uncultured Pleomorphomonas sp.]SCM70828.1 Glutamate--tRNA ligase 1 [uncultured Pleomorphomonas sp.]